MLGYIVLAIFQLIGGWLAAPHIVRHIPLSGDLTPFLYAAIFAVIVWLIGVIAAQIIKDVRMPSTSALASSIVLAVIVAAVLVFIPGLLSGLPIKVDSLALILLAAVLGYMMRR